jgi:hypothetical protein
MIPLPVTEGCAGAAEHPRGESRQDLSSKLSAREKVFG